MIANQNSSQNPLLSFIKIHTPKAESILSLMKHLANIFPDTSMPDHVLGTKETGIFIKGAQKSGRNLEMEAMN